MNWGADIQVRLTKPHPYVEVEIPIRGSSAYSYSDRFTTHELDRLDALINALLRAKDLLEQAGRAA